VVPDPGGLRSRIRPPSASTRSKQAGAPGHGGATTPVVSDLHPQQIGALALDGIDPDLN
jgi:hypothetical protein